MAALLNAGITPVVHEYGSLGCSGDLAPLSHCALVLMGEGSGASAPTASSAPVGRICSPRPGSRRSMLEAKEGLALINGTDGMLGMLIMAIADLEQLCDVADVTAAMSVEALLGTDQRVPRRAARAAASAPGPGAVSAREHARDARRLRHRRVAQGGRRPRSGRLLAALRAAGHRRGARHHHPRAAGRRARAGRRGRQPRRAARRHDRRATATSTAPRSATSSTSSRSLSADLGSMAERRTDRHARQGRAATGCRRSSPTTPASTPA